MPKRLDSWENKRAQELNVDGHGGAAALGNDAMRTAGELRPLNRRAKEVSSHSATSTITSRDG
jgi:hypothetical protein